MPCFDMLPPGDLASITFQQWEWVFGCYCQQLKRFRDWYIPFPKLRELACLQNGNPWDKVGLEYKKPLQVIWDKITVEVEDVGAKRGIFGYSFIPEPENKEIIKPGVLQIWGWQLSNSQWFAGQAQLTVEENAQVCSNIDFFEASLTDILGIHFAYTVLQDFASTACLIPDALKRYASEFQREVTDPIHNEMTALDTRIQRAGRACQKYVDLVIPYGKIKYWQSNIEIIEPSSELVLDGNLVVARIYLEDDQVVCANCLMVASVGYIETCGVCRQNNFVSPA